MLNLMLKLDTTHFALGQDNVIYSKTGSPTRILTSLNADYTYMVLEDKYIKCVKTGADLMYHGELVSIDVYMYNDEFWVNSSEVPLREDSEL